MRLTGLRRRGLLPFAIKSLYSPVKTFSSTKEEKSYTNPFIFILGFGLITAFLSSILNELGVDYSNPSNAGGSAQLLGPWVVQNLTPNVVGLARILMFTLSVEVGYLILTSLSVSLVSMIASFLIDREKKQGLFLKALKAVCYGFGPGLFFGWVPNPIYLFGLWALIWQAIAVYVYFEFTKMKAAITVVSWIVITGILHDAVSFLWALAS